MDPGRWCGLCCPPTQQPGNGNAVHQEAHLPNSCTPHLPTSPSSQCIHSAARTVKKERKLNGKTIIQTKDENSRDKIKSMSTSIPGPSQSRQVLLQLKQWPPASDWQHIGQLSSSLESSIHSLSYLHGCDESHLGRPVENQQMKQNPIEWDKWNSKHNCWE